MTVLVRIAEAAGALAVIGLVARSVVMVIRYSVWRRRLRMKKADEDRERMRREIEAEVRRELEHERDERGPEHAGDTRST